MRTVVITGANRGIGLALVKAALARGDHVIAASRVLAADATGGLEPGPLLEWLSLDVTDAASVASFAQAVEQRLAGAPLNVLINNAGIIGPARQSTLDTDFDGFAQTLAVNTLGPLRVTQALLPAILRAPQGKILTVTSAMGSMSHTRSDRIAYRASKAAVNKVMQGLATDLGPKGALVAVAHPGWVRTDMGGSGADISPEESARGLLSVVDRMEPANSGAFFNWSGERLPW